MRAQSLLVALCDARNGAGAWSLVFAGVRAFLVGVVGVFPRARISWRASDGWTTSSDYSDLKRATDQEGGERTCRNGDRGDDVRGWAMTELAGGDARSRFEWPVSNCVWADGLSLAWTCGDLVRAVRSRRERAGSALV